MRRTTSGVLVGVILLASATTPALAKGVSGAFRSGSSPSISVSSWRSREHYRSIRVGATSTGPTKTVVGRRPVPLKRVTSGAGCYAPMRARLMQAGQDFELADAGAHLLCGW